MLDINWNAMYSFWLVAESGSYAKAARILPRGSVQALHKRVQQLESEKNLNLKLFRSRGVKGVVLTDAGQRLHALLSSVFKRLDHIVVELRNEDSGQVKLGLSGFAAYNFGNQLLRKFHAAYPKVQVKMEIHEPAELVDLLCQDQIDFAIGSPPLGPTTLNIEGRIPINIRLIAPPSHPITRRRLTWSRVICNPLIVLDRNTIVRTAFENLLIRQNLFDQATFVLEVTTSELAVDAVSAGYGLALVPLGPRLNRQLRGLSQLSLPRGLERIDLAVISRRGQYYTRFMIEFMHIAAKTIQVAGDP